MASFAVTLEKKVALQREKLAVENRAAALTLTFQTLQYRAQLKNEGVTQEDIDLYMPLPSRPQPVPLPSQPQPVQVNEAPNHDGAENNDDESKVVDEKNDDDSGVADYVPAANDDDDYKGDGSDSETILLEMFE